MHGLFRLNLLLHKFGKNKGDCIVYVLLYIHQSHGAGKNFLPSYLETLDQKFVEPRGAKKGHPLIEFWPVQQELAKIQSC